MSTIYKVTTPEELLQRVEKEVVESNNIEFILDMLDDTYAFILKHKFVVGDNKKLTIEQLSVILNIPEDSVKQKEELAIESLTDYFRDKGLI